MFCYYSLVHPTFTCSVHYQNNFSVQNPDSKIMNLESGGMSFIFASLVFFTIRITADEMALTKEEESKILKEGVIIDLNVKFPFSNTTTVINDAITHGRLVNLTGNIIAWTDKITLTSFNDAKGVFLQTFVYSWDKLTTTEVAMIPWGLLGSTDSWNAKTRIKMDSKSSSQYLLSLPISEESKKQTDKAELESSNTILAEFSKPAAGQGYAYGGNKARTWWDRFWSGYWFNSGTLYQRVVPLLSTCSVVGVLSTDAQGNIVIQAHPQFGMLLFRKVNFQICAQRFALQAQTFKQLSKAAEFGCYLCMTVAGACLAVKMYSSFFPPAPPPPPSSSAGSDPLALRSMIQRREHEGDGSVEEAVQRSLRTRALEKSLECPITMQRMVDPVLW